jgi:hypothetical protein
MESTTLNKPKVSSGFAQKELDKAEKQFEKFEKEIKDCTLDRMNAAPKEDVEQQTKTSNREAQKADGIWLKPEKFHGPGVDPKTGKVEQFNEKFRSDYNFKKEYVKFIAENKEIIGESLELWTKPFPGVNAEFWKVPVNTVVWGPRYLAEQIKGSSYHRLRMDENKITGYNAAGSMTGQLVVDNIVQRLDAIPVSDKKSIFMGASSF